MAEPTTAFPHLLSPLRVGPKRLRNRVLVTSHVPGLAEAGVPGEHYAAYLRARAKGGAGLQITGATPVHASSSLGRSNAIENLDERVIPGYRILRQRREGQAHYRFLHAYNVGAAHRAFQATASHGDTLKGQAGSYQFDPRARPRTPRHCRAIDGAGVFAHLRSFLLRGNFLIRVSGDSQDGLVRRLNKAGDPPGHRCRAVVSAAPVPRWCRRR